MSLADEIREYVLVAVIKPARRRSDRTIPFTASSIHKGMCLQGNYMHHVCTAIDTQKFLKFPGVTLVQRTGPLQSTTARWTFRI